MSDPMTMIMRAGAAGATAQDQLEVTGGRAALLAAGLVVVAGIFAAGVLAFTGRWRSWYSGGWQQNHRPLAAPWFAGAVLLVAALLGLDALLDHAPLWVMAPGLVLVLAGVVTGTVYAVHPPRRMLPKWIRAMEEDPLGEAARAQPALDKILSGWKSNWGKSALGRRLLVGFLSVALPGAFLYLVHPLWWYATGTSTTATVEHCGYPSGGGRNTICSGKWTLPDGAGGQGRIAGAGKGDVGKAVEVRASASHAAILNLRLVYGPVIVLFLAVLFAYVGYRQRRAARDRAPAGP
ncbi:hypothetical protein HUT06_05835 [Actinomadura sp. NAK00032]|uniref:hypothetical protein n=1 Tax=Actinomadura sp. NAK00032 TaxID=2742128 RepID=UPI001591CB28|nr:hypothetical protein [Actinomadura sp. NAK00032]QKW33609.1 hypothetical protein HUT06_05835 [Actinomadura sp. NAK00032]